MSESDYFTVGSLYSVVIVGSFRASEKALLVAFVRALARKSSQVKIKQYHYFASRLFGLLLAEEGTHGVRGCRRS